MNRSTRSRYASGLRVKNNPNPKDMPVLWEAAVKGVLHHIAEDLDSDWLTHPYDWAMFAHWLLVWS